MTDGKCPKCGSNEVFTDANITVKANGWGLNQVVAKSGLIGRSLTEYDNYLCGNCGYMERYINNISDRQWVVENWTHVQDQSEG